MNRNELLAVSVRGMSFSTPMVQALPIKDRTMRAIKGPLNDEYRDHVYHVEPGDEFVFYDYHEVLCREKPRHKVGDIVYVREAWNKKECWRNGCPAGDEFPCSLAGCLFGERAYLYRADKFEDQPVTDCGCDLYEDMRWRPSIHMPKAAAKTFIRITGVEVQRPQELTIEEIIAEGIDWHGVLRSEFKGKWKDLWDSVQQKKLLPLYGYEANPWCFTYKFEVIPYDQ